MRSYAARFKEIVEESESLLHGRGHHWKVIGPMILLFTLCIPGPSQQKNKIQVRTITAFINIDRNHYQTQVGDALKMLRNARAVFVAEGYGVETIRITTQPFPSYTQGLSRQDALIFFRKFDDLAGQEGFIANIGPAMMRDSDDPKEGELLSEVLSTTRFLQGSIIVGGSDGIYWSAIQEAAKVIHYIAEHSLHGEGNFSFSAIAMLGPYAPFYPGSYHTGPGDKFSIGLEGAGLVDQVLSTPEPDPAIVLQRLSTALAKHGVAVEKVARNVERRSGWTYMGIDMTPAPAGDVSIGAAIEKFTGGYFGASGTMTAAGLITQAVRAAPVKAVGYSGLMLPVLEDSRLAQRWSEGTYRIDSLLAYSSVCGTGLDTLPLPGDVTETQLERIIGDVATLSVKWKKPLAARLLPARGRKAGDLTEFATPFLLNSKLQPLP